MPSDRVSFTSTATNTAMEHGLGRAILDSLEREVQSLTARSGEEVADVVASPVRRVTLPGIGAHLFFVPRDARCVVLAVWPIQDQTVQSLGDLRTTIRVSLQEESEGAARDVEDTFKFLRSIR